ncbi:MFS-type transporter dbaD [Fulvia fulva]|uniref:MFS-type transporter dbaD n=1 Tax=Passalora fulva TaxID=5499 RepID=A0A9Q8PBY2_PASFU|nr:MFS-type transporter dbaD [Fulvia fulva]KAK4620099.1 MFS-type transporter dbaD [Fulvia fulva]KAK4620668.1 MFS-type transporter dbaD [Fulvia fulva]UJO19657.1 MFS-type transporter dbaD [Fulvia fulva]WPV17001.1 MFS-type transporter dbaD [Fulvia fulva]WPV32141.1 MFS-type transporter dbaD [Fulvia fulva]
MSHASTNSDLDHDINEKGTSRSKAGEDGVHLTEGQEELREAPEPTFIATDDADVTADGALGAVLEKVASSKPSVNNIKSVPNGGLTAWLQVVGSFFLFMNTWGVVNTFGTYQTYYEAGILASSSPSDISWIGSLQATLLMVVGSLTGPVYDAGYVRSLVSVGTFLVVFGQMMLSLSTTYYQVFLSQAVCIGIGTGCLFIPCVAILSTYFSTRIATAVGLAAAGSSIGGVIYPVVFYRLQPTIGFPWATRVIGFLMLATLAVSNAVLKVRVLPAGRRKFFDLSAWKEGPFTFFVLATFIGFLGLYTPFFYLQSYAIQTGIADPDLAFYLLAILNAASTFGRVIPNLIADRIGPFNVIIPCTLATGILCICLAPTRSVAPVIVIAVLYGFFSGTFVSLPATIYVHITENRGLIGTRMGMGFSCTAIGILVGTPISGAILDASSYTYVWIWGGIMTIVAAGILVIARVCKGGWKIMKVV